MKRNLRLATILATLLGGGSGINCALAQPTLVWTGSKGNAAVDRAVGVAGSLSHVYVGGRLEGDNDVGSMFHLIQYQYAGSGGAGQIRSEVSYPSYFSPDYDATCMASISLGTVNTTYGFQYTQIIIAGTVPGPYGLVPVVASFETKPESMGGSGIGDLRLMWSFIPSSNEDRPPGDEIPIDVTIDGERVAVVSKYVDGTTPKGLCVRSFDYNTGQMDLKGSYIVTGARPAGLMLAGNFIVVGGSGPNGSSDPQAFVLGYAIDADPGYYTAGTRFGPDFVSPGSGRTFAATCFTASENGQANFGGSPFYALAGRSFSNSEPSDGDWLVLAYELTFNSTTHAPNLTPDWTSDGQSSSSFDDVPVSMCIGYTPTNYEDEDPPTIPAYFRLWVTGDRVPVSGGDSQVTTVQFDVDGGSTGAGGMEWHNHFALSGRSCRASSIGATDFTSGLDTRAYVGAFVEDATTTTDTDFAMLKYSSEPTSPFPGGNQANLWGTGGEVHSLSGSQRSVAIMPLNIGTSSDNRVIMITGAAGNLPDWLTLRYQDDQ